MVLDLELGTSEPSRPIFLFQREQEFSYSTYSPALTSKPHQQTVQTISHH